MQLKHVVASRELLHTIVPQTTQAPHLGQMPLSWVERFMTGSSSTMRQFCPFLRSSWGAEEMKSRGTDCDKDIGAGAYSGGSWPNLLISR